MQQIGGGLSAAQDDIGWVQTAYLIAEIAVIPLSGWLTRVFSTRWLFVGSAFGFTIASMLCGLATSIDSMIAFRALQGMLGASMIPTVFTSSFHYFQGKRRIYSVAVIGTIASIAPTLGPIIGGWITDTLTWRWVFYVNLVPGLLVTVGVALLVDIDTADLKWPSSRPGRPRSSGSPATSLSARGWTRAAPAHSTQPNSMLRSN